MNLIDFTIEMGRSAFGDTLLATSEFKPYVMKYVVMQCKFRYFGNSVKNSYVSCY